MKNPELAAASIENIVIGPIVAIRLDGVRFSKLTKSPVFVKPFDLGFADAMRAAMMALVSKDFGAPCVLAYTQSDEITMLLDFSRSQWLGGRATKITTTAASLAATAFTWSTASSSEVLSTGKTWTCWSRSRRGLQK